MIQYHYTYPVLIGPNGISVLRDNDSLHIHWFSGVGLVIHLCDKEDSTKNYYRLCLKRFAKFLKYWKK